MTIEEVINYYGSGYMMKKTHGLSPTNPSNWRRYGYIPIETQLKIERLTRGDLKANLNHCPKDYDV